MTPEELTKLAMQKSGLVSTRSMGKHLKISHMKVHSWLQNEICPSFEMAYALAEMAGLPGVETAASVRQHSPEGKKHLPLLRRIANVTAMGGAICLAVYMSSSASAENPHNTGDNVYYVKYSMCAAYPVQLSCLAKSVVLPELMSFSANDVVNRLLAR